MGCVIHEDAPRSGALASKEHEAGLEARGPA